MPPDCSLYSRKPLETFLIRLKACKLSLNQSNEKLF